LIGIAGGDIESGAGDDTVAPVPEAIFVIPPETVDDTAVA
jgi:hypothetical protein